MAGFNCFHGLEAGSNGKCIGVSAFGHLRLGRQDQKVVGIAGIVGIVGIAHRRGGEIGRRARLRIWWSNP